MAKGYFSRIGTYVSRTLAALGLTTALASPAFGQAAPATQPLKYNDFHKVVTVQELPGRNLYGDGNRRALYIELDQVNDLEVFERIAKAENPADPTPLEPSEDVPVVEPGTVPDSSPPPTPPEVDLRLVVYGEDTDLDSLAAQLRINPETYVAVSREAQRRVLNSGGRQIVAWPMLQTDPADPAKQVTIDKQEYAFVVSEDVVSYVSPTSDVGKRVRAVQAELAKNDPGYIRLADALRRGSLESTEGFDHAKLELMADDLDREAGEQMNRIVEAVRARLQ